MPGPRSAPAVVALLALAAAAAALPARAHDIAMLTAVAEIRRDRTFAVEVFVHRNAVAVGFGKDAPPVAIEGLPPADEVLRNEARGVLRGFTVLFDGAPAPWRAALVGEVIESEFHLLLRGEIPAGARTFTFHTGEAIDVYAASVRHEGKEAGAAAILRFGNPLPPVPLDEAFVPKPSASATAVNFVGHGFLHILPRGLDHVLFVLGLFLLSTRLKPLLLQVTSFTVAHTVTLGLSMFGVVRLPSSVVEPLIAVSIAYVAVENLCTQEIRRSRVALVFGFGLLHGLGFAGALAQLGLPQGQRAVALFSFNAGVELGQLSVLLAAWLVLALPFGAKPWYRKRIVVPLSLAIAACGLYWAVTRVLGS